MTLEDELRDAKAEVARIEEAIRRRDEYPVGAILRNVHQPDILAIRLGSVNDYDASSSHPQTDNPVWITLWTSDFSGSQFDSLDDLQGNYYGEWEKIA